MVYSLLFNNLDSCNAIWSWILQNVDKNKHGTHVWNYKYINVYKFDICYSI